MHLRAAEWYEQQGALNDAFRHAVAVHDFERAARLIEENWLRVGHAGEMNTVLRWLESMPEEVVRARPMLCGAFAWVLWLTGRIDAVEPYLDAVNDEWERQAAAGSISPDDARWQAGGPALRTNLARHRGQLEEAIQWARQTLALAPPDDPLLRSYGYLGLAHTYRELGDYEEYKQLFQDAGWEMVDEMLGWQYFRKPAAADGPNEIYTDAESKVERYRRVLGYLIIFMPIYIVLLTRDLPGPIKLVFGLIILLWAYSMVRILGQIRQLQHL